MDERMDIGIAVRRLSLQMRRHHDAAVDRLSGGRLTGARGWIIGYLASHDGKPVYQRDIETRFGIRRSTATVMLQLMEKNGMITRASDANDKRLKRLLLTDAARELLAELDRERYEFELLCKRGLSEEELAVFFTVADKIAANIKENDNTTEEHIDD